MGFQRKAVSTKRDAPGHTARAGCLASCQPHWRKKMLSQSLRLVTSSCLALVHWPLDNPFVYGKKTLHKQEETSGDGKARVLNIFLQMLSFLPWGRAPVGNWRWTLSRQEGGPGTRCSGLRDSKTQPQLNLSFLLCILPALLTHGPPA